ncbi:hypothetical protein G6F56_005840 [Rhizopus delemar]|nr:hypothetical protein G6F56_005840 [Rhizopus delemar]
MSNKLYNPLIQLNTLSQLRYISTKRKLVYITKQDVKNCKERMTEIDHPYQYMIGKTEFRTVKEKSDTCDICDQKFESCDSKPLSLPSKYHLGVCTGCSRLFGKSNELTKNIIKSRLLTSDTNMHTMVSKSGIRKFDATQYQALVHTLEFSHLLFMENNWCQIKAQNMMKNMKQRKAKRSGSNQEFATKDQLMDLIRQSNGKCAVSGSLGLWKSSNLDPFQLTVDHIEPLSKGGSNVINNLRPMFRCLNFVKSNESEQEFRRWLDGFRFSVPLEKLVFY